MPEGDAGSSKAYSSSASPQEQPLTRPRANAVSELIGRNKIWCPAADEHMKSVASGAAMYLNVYPVLLSFGKRELKSFAPSGKLYIVCHGHEALPIFTNSMGKWTAENIAEMLELDGLSKEQQVIELLVCYAGLSVNSIERLKKIQALQSEAARLGAGKEQSAAIAALVRMQKEPSELKPYSNPQQVMPLANQLFNALTSRGYTKLKLISYKAKVSQAIDANGVLVDLPGYAGPKSVKHLPGIIHVLEQAKPSGSSSSSASSSSNG